MIYLSAAKDMIERDKVVEVKGSLERISNTNWLQFHDLETALEAKLLDETHILAKTLRESRSQNAEIRKSK